MPLGFTRSAPRLTRRVALGHAATGIGAAIGIGAAAGRAAAEDGTPIPAEIVWDIVYGTIDGEDLELDVVLPPPRAEPRPAVILIHGGGLVQSGPKRISLNHAAEALAAAGYVSFNIDYRLLQDDGTNPWPAQLDDVQRAVRWLRANASMYGVDPERIGAFGVSSGGQLAAFLGTRETRDNSVPDLAGLSSKVTCVVSLAGNFDMTIPYKFDDIGAIDAEVMTGTRGATPSAEQIRDFSPINFVDETSVPFLICQEGSEDVVPYAHAQRMVAALQDARVQVSYGWFPEYDHFSWEVWAPEAPETLAFFGRHLQPER